jgi:hypothetical protein
MVEIAQYFGNTISSATLGNCSFKISEDIYPKIRNMYMNGTRLFYITSTNQGVRNLIYSGLFTAEDPTFLVQSDIETPIPQPIVPDVNSGGTALVSRRIAEKSNQSSGFSSTF